MDKASERADSQAGQSGDERPARRPSGAPEIPDVLRERPRVEARREASTMSALGRGLALGWDLVGSVAAGLLLGVLVDRWLGVSPAGVLVGLALGTTVSTVRIIRQSARDNRSG